MNLIIDTNVLISALIKDSIKRKIIIQSGWKFYYPSEAMKEVEKYKDIIMDKSGLSEEDLNIILNYLISYIELVSQEKIISKIEEANAIMGNIDKDDVVFIAAALSLANEGIWSDDGHFKMQNKIKCWETSEILSHFESQKIQKP